MVISIENPKELFWIFRLTDRTHQLLYGRRPNDNRPAGEADTKGSTMLYRLFRNGYVDAVRPSTAYALIERCNELGIACRAGYCSDPQQSGLCYVVVDIEEWE